MAAQLQLREPQMNADEHRRKTNDTTHRIIGCAYTVSNTLGCGFLEKVYENALALELRKQGLAVQQQYPIDVTYDGQVVGQYVTDMLVEESVLIELKSMKMIEDIHIAQCLNYLAATKLQVCLLLNFDSPKLEVRRLVRDF